MTTATPTLFKRFLRVLTLVLILAAGTLAAPAQTHRGEKSFGVKAGYISCNRSAVGGLVFQYSFGRHVRIAPQLGVVFRHQDHDAFTVDVDVHFPISLGSARAAFYPLAGLAFNSWTGHKTVDTDDVTTHTNNMGGNLGGGFEFRCTPSLKISVEGRYTFLKHFSNAQVVAGIAYVF